MRRLKIGLSKVPTAVYIVILAVLWALLMNSLPTQRETEIQCYGGQWQTVSGTYLVKDGIRLECK